MITLNQEGTAYLKDGLEFSRVTDILKSCGIIDPRWFDEFAALRGTYVHKATHLFDQGILNFKTLDPQLLGYVNAWASFRKDHPQLKFLAGEMTVYSERLRSAGTLDVLAESPGCLEIIDKKAATTLNPAVEIQTAAYMTMYREMTAHKKVIKRRAVQLFPDGTYKSRILADVNDVSIWLSAVNIHNWKRKRR